MRAKFALGVGMALSIACGGGGVTSPTPTGYGSVSFQKYKYDTTTMQFNNDTKVTTWWSNMSCDALEGTWTQEGDEIHIQFNDPADCMGYDEMKVRQMSDCSMVTYWMKNTQTGDSKDDDPWMWERKEPKCR